MRMPDYGQRVIARPDNTIEIESFAPRPPGPGEVLIATEATLISAGTELAMLAESRTADFCLGYSHVGRIVALGEGVEGLSVGRRVLSLGCHASHVTVSAAPASVVPVPERACPDTMTPDASAGQDPATSLGTERSHGGRDEAVAGHGTITPEEATFGVLGSVSAHGVRKARPEMGEHVLVTGMGIVGQLALQFAAQAGCETLIASDLSDRRLALARDLTGAATLNPATCCMAEEIERLTEGCGLDCIIEASGYPDHLPELFDMARIGGRIVLLGSIWHRKVEVDFMPFHLNELTLIGAHQPKCPTAATPAFPWTQQYNRAQTLKMIADGRLKVRPLITHVLPFEQAAEGYRLLREERDRALGIVLDFRSRTAT